MKHAGVINASRKQGERRDLASLVSRTGEGVVPSLLGSFPITDSYMQHQFHYWEPQT